MRYAPLLLVFAWTSVVANDAARAEEGGPSSRRVLVELYTSQGCDMCPEAERLLGLLGEGDSRVVPIAFHVDYFNAPWKDPFSDSLYSKRQAAFNSIYTGPKPADYGLYYTPMVMVDGIQSVNGRDPAAIRQASMRKPKVSLLVSHGGSGDRRSGEYRVAISSRSATVVGREILVCAVLRDDMVVTEVRSGENANKALTARYPARATRFEFTRLESGKATTLQFPFRLEPAWKVDRLRLAVFAQDKETGEIYQAAQLPWGLPAGDRKRGGPHPDGGD